MNDSDTRDRTIARTQSYLELLRAQNWDKWIDLWAEDAVLEFPFAPEGRSRVFRGKKDILDYMSGTTGTIVVDSVANLRIFPMLDPETVAVELTINGHLVSNSAPYNQTYVTIFEFQDGEIKHYREYWNPLVSITAHGSYDAWMNAFATRAEAAPH